MRALVENCTREREDLICENTYGLYPNQFACNGGEFHGQHCLGFNDAATCFSLTDQRAACEDRDLQPGIKGTNLKKLVDPTDPSVMLHAVYYGDIYFVDWIHRSVQAVWSELCTDAAAAVRGKEHALQTHWHVGNIYFCEGYSRYK